MSIPQRSCRAIVRSGSVERLHVYARIVKIVKPLPLDRRTTVDGTVMTCSDNLNGDGSVPVHRHIGIAIRSARQRAGLTLRGMAERLQVSPSTISAIENGKTGVSVARLESLAQVLGTSSSRLLAKKAPSPTAGEPGSVATTSD